MGRPKTSWLVAREVLLALARGATVRQAADLAGLSVRTVDNLISEHGRMSHVACYRPRPGVLTPEEESDPFLTSAEIGISPNKSIFRFFASILTPPSPKI